MYYSNALRINLKTDCSDREQLIDFCLRGQQQYLAIGWSYIYKKAASQIEDYNSFYQAVRSDVKRINHALNAFWNVEEGDLLWTRDLEGIYWICRCTGKAMSLNQADIPIEQGIRMDVGAVVPVLAFPVGTQVPGAIKASFNRARGGIIEEIRDEVMTHYAKAEYNKESGKNQYELLPPSEAKALSSEQVIRNLPDFELEELVMSYIQIKHNYYLLSNSIANKSTTIKVEGEFLSRDLNHPGKAVVQVKGPKYSDVLSAHDFAEFIAAGYTVFLYAPHCDDCGEKSVITISESELKDFYYQHKAILPRSITEMEDIFKIQ